MARKTTIIPPQAANLTAAQKRAGLPKLKRLLDRLKIFDASIITGRDDAKASALETDVDRVLTDVFGHDTVEYRRYSAAKHIQTMSISFMDTPSRQEAIQEFEQGRGYAVALIEAAIAGLEEDLENAEPEEASASLTPVKAAALSRRVFVVHGRDLGTAHEVAGFLTKIDLKPVLLSEEASGGKTIIEKIEHYSDVGFSVILLTPDDVGGLDKDNLNPRARQNVILELGYFIGYFRTRLKVCPLIKGDVEKPSDMHGIVYVDMDAGGGWKLRLAREIKEAGISIDMNKVM